MDNINRYNQLETALAAATKEVKPLSYIEPVNEADQKSEFLSHLIENPNFTYKPLSYNPNQVEQDLRAFEIPEGPLATLYERNREHALLANDTIRNRGVSEMVQQNTSQVYGVPSVELVRYADSILRQSEPVETPKTVPAHQVKEVLEAALGRLGLTDSGWKVELSTKKLTTVIPSERKINLCQSRTFGTQDAARLAIHEVGVHALRAANGYEQPLNIFALGLPNYLSTEEGLASYVEEMTDNSDTETLRGYAARVIAVDSVVQGLDFRQTFERMKEYQFSDDQAWDTTLRAHRGGGYLKDHLYLDGLQKVQHFVAEGGDIRELYVGKVGLEDLPLVRTLRNEEILKPAKYLPDFLK